MLNNINLSEKSLCLILSKCRSDDCKSQFIKDFSIPFQTLDASPSFYFEVASLVNRLVIQNSLLSDSYSDPDMPNYFFLSGLTLGSLRGMKLNKY